MFRRWFACSLFFVLSVAFWSDVGATDRSIRRPLPMPIDAPFDDSPFSLQVEIGQEDIQLVSSHEQNKAMTASGLWNTSAREPIHSLLNLWDSPSLKNEILFVADEGISHEETWQLLPNGLMYKSYLAGEKESRVSSVWLTDQNGNLVWETALGGRYCFVRYGTSDPAFPEGWQMDFEGAALPRVDPDLPSSPLIAADFRIGLLSTWRRGPNAFKAGYYHLSSHLGDEFLLLNSGYVRLNYVRDSFIVGWTRYVTDELQVYGEIAYAFNYEDGAEPLELQYGVQYSPQVPGLYGAPFGGINGHTRQDFDYGTSVNAMVGWQWWSEESNRTFRIGLQYYDGPALQYSFVNKHEKLMGWGLWLDY